MERVRAEGARRGFEFGVKAGESIANHADNDGRIVKDVRNKDCPEGTNKWERRKRKEGMNESAWTEEGTESRGDNDGWKHERDSGQCAQKRFAVKVL